MPPKGWMSVKISRIEWAALKEAAKRDYGLPMGAFLEVLAANWLRQRWPLGIEPLEAAKEEEVDKGG